MENGCCLKELDLNMNLSSLFSSGMETSQEHRSSSDVTMTSLIYFSIEVLSLLKFFMMLPRHLSEDDCTKPLYVNNEVMVTWSDYSILLTPWWIYLSSFGSDVLMTIKNPECFLQNKQFCHFDTPYKFYLMSSVSTSFHVQ